MKPPHLKKLIVNLVVAFALTTSAFVSLADDLFPPPWRGLPGSTWAQWEYSTPDPNPLPDAGFNPYGVPQTQVYADYFPSLNGRQGVWSFSGEIWVDIPNRPEPWPWKDIQIQLTWEEQASGERPFVVTTAPEAINGTLVQEIALEGLWKHSIYTIHLEPNPAWEQIKISGNIDVDQLVIDTICIPEPAALALLTLGGLILCRRRHP